MILTFDMGNSYIKWGLWRHGEMTDSGQVVSAVHALQHLLDSFNNNDVIAEKIILEKVLAVCVAGEAMKQALMVAVQEKWQMEVVFLRTERLYQACSRTLVNAYQDVQNHGADRWATLIAACEEFTQPLCVISAGTAITFDLVQADGKHLGGRILPSWQTMRAALLQNAANIQHLPVDDEANKAGCGLESVPPLFASNTEAAMNSGVYYLLAAGLVDACHQVIETLGESVKIIITGGCASRVMAILNPVCQGGVKPFAPRLIHRPALVLQGLMLQWNSALTQTDIIREQDKN